MKRFYLLLATVLAGISLGRAQTCPTTISSFPYSQDFESGAGGWVSGGVSSSWALGTPAKTVINSAASGTKAWVTNLAGQYNSTESSQVVSPCFNFSNLVSPVFEMKVWWNCETNYDGAVLQSSIDGGLTWQNVGAFGDPDHWFNNNSISAGPGGQQIPAIGWSGTNSFAGSNGWVTAKHRLTGLGGQASVKLRVAFASDGGTEDDGFAFDNVMIYEAPTNDVGVIAVVPPQSGCGLSAQETITITVRNFGIATQNAIPVSYKIGNNAPVNETIPGALLPDSVVTYSFTTKADFSAPGNYAILAQTNLVGDVLTFNNAVTSNLTSVPTIATFPYFENFESGPNGWLAGGTNSSWVLGKPVKNVINSAGSGLKSWVTSLSGDYNSNENSAVESPCFNLSSLVLPVIQLKIWWESETDWDGAVLQSSIDGGQTWQNVGAFGDPNHWFNNNAVNSNPGAQMMTMEGWSGFGPDGSGGWVTAKNYLSGLGGQTSVKFRIAFASDGFAEDNGFAFDDFSISEAPANDVGVIALKRPLSSTCGGGAQEDVSVLIKNFGSAAQTSIPLTYNFTGGAGGSGSGTFTGNLLPGDTVRYTFPVKANLTAAGIYTFSAAANLTGDADVSNNGAQKTLTIFNPVTTFPYLQNFESGVTGSPGTLPAGWTMQAPANNWSVYRWEMNAGPTFNPRTGPVTDHTLGTALGQYVFANSGNGMFGDSTELITPCLDLTSLSNPGLDFWYHMAGGAIGSLEVQITTNNGLTWDSLFTLTGSQQAAPADPWIKKTLSLAGYTGIVRVRFRAFSGGMSIMGGGDIALDDIRIFNLPIDDLQAMLPALPASTCGLTSSENICFSIKNNGTMPVSNFPVSYQIGTNTPVTETYTGTIAAGATVQYCFTTKANFSVPATYPVTISAQLPTDGDPLNNSVSGSVTSVPIISTFPYIQGFENGDGGWLASGTNSTWELGTPAKQFINSAGGGTKSWVTSLTGVHNNLEQSQVVSPCFNFSGIADPDFEMKAWWDCRFGNDGAVLQSSIDGGLTWQNVGFYNDSVNWYTTDYIGAQPGGQTGLIAAGWSGWPVNNGSLGWVTVKHKLTGLGGQPSVKLRIAFGSDNNGQMDGFAFDDVKVIDNTNNLAIRSFVPMPQVCGFNTSEPVSVVIQNLGSTPVSGFTLSYSVDGGPAVTEPFTGPFAAGAISTFNFTTGANLVTPGAHTIVVTINHAPDPYPSNNSISHTVNNALLTTVLPIDLDFETQVTGINSLQVVTKPASAITELAGCGSGSTATKGLVMDGRTNVNWQTPIGIIDPWATNADNFSGAYLCFSPNASTYDSLILHFDLKQLFLGANGNTNFRVTVNGVQVGNTYRPPYSGSPINWQKVKINLTPYKHLANIQVGLESSVSEEYDNGNGPANLIDNIHLERKLISGLAPEKELSRLVVYPNPSAGRFRVRLPQGKVFALEVTDLAGRVIWKGTAQTGSPELDLTKAAKGVYLLRATSEGSTSLTKLIVE